MNTKQPTISALIIVLSLFIVGCNAQQTTITTDFKESTEFKALVSHLQQKSAGFRLELKNSNARDRLSEYSQADIDRYKLESQQVIDRIQKLQDRSDESIAGVELETFSESSFEIREILRSNHPRNYTSQKKLIELILDVKDVYPHLSGDEIYTAANSYSQQ